MIKKNELESLEELTQQLEGEKAIVKQREEEISNLLKEIAVLMQEQETAPEARQQCNRGKTIEEVLSRQARRKLSEFKSYADQALWFAKSFGLVPDYIALHEAKSGSPLKICLTGEVPIAYQQESTKHTDMDKVYEVMYNSPSVMRRTMRSGWPQNRVDTLCYPLCMWSNKHERK